MARGIPRQDSNRFPTAKHVVHLRARYIYIVRRGDDYLQAHRNHAQYMLQQQHEWMQLQNTVSQTYQEKETLYLHASKTVKQTRPYCSYANGHESSGNPLCGKCHCNPCPNDSRRIGIQQSGKYPSTHTRADINGKPRGTSPERTSACTPRHPPNLYLAQTLPMRHMALSSLAYLIKKSPPCQASCAVTAVLWDLELT